jgi:hypothetical protein
MHSFNDCKSRWSKEPQWENDRGSFFTMFSTSGFIILDIDDQLLCSDVQTEVGQMYDEL